ncbi:MAG: hypothetical protein WC529_07465 [Candidatus Margulisiibacteriota bacterium]
MCLLLIAAATAVLAATEEAGLIWSLPGTKLALPALFTDGEGGIVLFSHDVGAYDSVNKTISKIRAQARRITPTGSLQWTTVLGTNEASSSVGWGSGFSAQKNGARAADYNYVFGVNQIKPMYTGRAGAVTFRNTSAAPARVALDDGAGGFFATIGGTGVLYGLKIDQTGTLTTTINLVAKPGVDMTDVREMSQTPTLIKTSDGEYATVWIEAATSEGGIDLDTSSIVYIQKVDSSGNMRWGGGTTNTALRLTPAALLVTDPLATGEANGEIPVIASDGAGGAVAFWVQDMRNWQTQRKIWGAHILANGTFAPGWASMDMHVPSGTIANLSAMSTRESDGNNYYYIAFNTSPTTLEEYFVMQKFQANGSAAAGWPPGGILMDNEGRSTGYLAPDGRDGALFSYTAHPDSLPAGLNYGRVARVTSGGGLAWKANLTTGFDYPAPLTSKATAAEIIYVSSTLEGAQFRVVVTKLNPLDGSFNWQTKIGAPGIDYFGLPVRDGAGGAIVTWWNRDALPVGEADMLPRRIYAQRISGSGEVLWQNQAMITVESGAADNDYFTAGVSCLGTGEANVLTMPLVGVTGLLARVGDQSVDQLLYNAQKLDAASGRKLWGYDGTTFHVLPTYDTDNIGSLAVGADDRGGAIFTWTYSKEVYASWVDANGSPEAAFLSGPAVVAVKTAATNNTFPQVHYTGSDTAVILWDHNNSGLKTFRARTLSRSGALGATNVLASGRSGMNVTRNSYQLADGRILAVADDFQVNKGRGLLISTAGTLLGSIEAPAGHVLSSVAPADDNTVLFSYCASSEAYKYVGGQIYINKVPVSSCEGAAYLVDPATAWQVLGPSVPQSANFGYSLNYDGSGGAIVIFMDLRGLSAAQAQRFNDLYLADGLDGILSAETMAMPIAVYGQRLDRNGNRLWGESGVKLSDGSKAQFWPDSIASTPNGTAILAYLNMDTSYDKGQIGVFVEPLIPVRKVGAIGRSNFSVAADGLAISSAERRDSSASPEVIVSLANPGDIASLKVYVNNELKLNKTTGLSATNTFTLDLSVKGTYDIKVLVTDRNGNESVISFTLESPGAGVMAVVGTLTIAPLPYTPTAGAATISYVLANDASVRLLGMSPVGGEPIINRTFPAGTQGGMASYNAVSWDGKDQSGNYVGNGIYPVKLLTADGKELGKAYIVVK